MQRLLSLIPPGITRIDLLAPPFAGHLHPVLAMGKALSAHYHVRIISTRRSEPHILAAGLSALILPGAYDESLQGVANPRYAIKSSPLKLCRQFRAVVGLLKNFADELTQLWHRAGVPELAIADFTLPIAGDVCRQLDIIWWTSMPSPCVLEGPDGTPAYCGGLMPAKNRLGRIWHNVQRQKVRIFKRTVFALFRRTISQTGITRLYRADGSESAYSPYRILALSEREFEFPQTWPAALTFIGPALYTPPLGFQAPPFKEGKRHVLVTLGTHLDWHKDAVVEAVMVLAGTLPDWEFHFTDGNSSAGDQHQQGNFWRVSWVDYDRWLPRYDAVIHHGGAGIMWHCLKQDIPALVYPVDYDQFDHAARLEFSGKGIWLRGGLRALSESGDKLRGLVEGRGKAD